MPIPDFQTLMLPLLKILSDRQVHTKTQSQRREKLRGSARNCSFVLGHTTRRRSRNSSVWTPSIPVAPLFCSTCFSAAIMLLRSITFSIRSLPWSLQGDVLVCADEVLSPPAVLCVFTAISCREALVWGFCFPCHSFELIRFTSNLMFGPSLDRVCIG